MSAFFSRMRLNRYGAAASQYTERAIDGVLERVRLTKSPAELAYIRRAATLSQVGVDAGCAAIREGGRDRDVGAAISAAIYSAGSDLVCWGPIVAAGYRVIRVT